MRFAVWSARQEAVQDGHVLSEYQKAAAGRGSAIAERSLETPPLPDAVSYLWRWVIDLRRGLGVGMNGLNALTWIALDAWSRLNAVLLDYEEASLLLALDAAIRNPDGAEAMLARQERPLLSLVPGGSQYVARKAWPAKKSSETAWT